jgi:hypothetical protein
MRPPSIAMRTALRILSALVEHNAPAAEDVACLRDAEHDPHTPIDELACSVIQREVYGRGTKSACT